MKTKAFCGIDCVTCAVYKASQSGDTAEKERVAKDWSVLTEQDLKPSNISCEGCKSDNLFRFCGDCGFRKCNSEKGLTRCKDCTDFPCKTHSDFAGFQEPFGTVIRFD